MSIASGPPTSLAYPTHLDLPCTDDQPTENHYQLFQEWLLVDSFGTHLARLHQDGNFLLGADSGIHFRRTPLR